MQASATPFEPAARRSAAPEVLRRSLPTPLLRLQRSGDGRVWLKLEGASLPSGSWLDRVVAAASRDGLPSSVVVPAADAFAYAVALRLVPLGVGVSVVETRDASKRLRKLLIGAGARVRLVADEAAREQRVARELESGATLWTRGGNPAATASALRDIALESRAALRTRPSVWVLPDTGLDLATLRRTLDAPRARIITVADDAEQRRALAPDASCRRQQTAHREGVLLSPLGAEIVTEALSAADDASGAVVAVVPEDGRRFVGWW